MCVCVCVCERYGLFENVKEKNKHRDTKGEVESEWEESGVTSTSLAWSPDR